MPKVLFMIMKNFSATLFSCPHLSGMFLFWQQPVESLPPRSQSVRPHNLVLGSVGPPATWVLSPAGTRPAVVGPPGPTSVGAGPPGPASVGIGLASVGVWPASVGVSPASVGVSPTGPRVPA